MAPSSMAGCLNSRADGITLAGSHKFGREI